MRQISVKEYRSFRKTHTFVEIDGSKIELTLGEGRNGTQPNNFKPEEYTLWSFPDRGDWATHRGDYRGNWSPYVPRNLILKYTAPCDTVLDPMCGGGTTLVEAKLLGRNAIGVDINTNAVMVSRSRLDFLNSNKCTALTYIGDARNLDLIRSNSIDLVAIHPPYAGIIHYSNRKNNVDIRDISSLSFTEYIIAVNSIAKECLRVLKAGKYCAILIGDTRKKRHYIPISVWVLSVFLKVGFILKEDIIKAQHKTKITREKWRSHNYDFYKIAHEHLYVFRKPLPNENLSELRYSRTTNLQPEFQKEL
jgi:DNA modification methylase